MTAASAPLTLDRAPRSSFWRNIRRALVNLLFAAVNLYTIGIGIALILRLLIGDANPYSGVVTNLTPMILLPAPILLLLSLPLMTRAGFIARRRVTLATTGALTALLIVGWGGLFIPSDWRAARALSGETEITVMTHNWQTQRDADAAIGAVLASGADVIALQEISTEAAAQIAQAMIEEYPYQALYGSDRFAVGMAVISRLPILEESYWEHTAFGYQRVVFGEAGTPLFTLLNAHPPPPREFGLNIDQRSLEIAQFLPYIDREDGALLVVGDFNMSDSARDYGRLRERLNDSWREVGFGFGTTFPNFDNWITRAIDIPFNPPALIRIDYVFHSDHWRAVAMDVGTDSGGSDHYPVIARLMLNE